jgi:endonuclease-8
MPEGPTIVILKEEVRSFTVKKILIAEGNRKLELHRLSCKKVIDF